MAQTENEDLVIFVMGPMAAGKSTFICSVLNDFSYSGDKPDTTDTFKPCTKRLESYSVDLPLQSNTTTTQRLVLVDTPGFDSGCESTLKSLKAWLRDSYGPRMKVAGLLYMYGIDVSARITAAEVGNLKLFERLCGNGGLQKARMVTSRWGAGGFTEAEQAKREAELKSGYWKALLARGCTYSKLLQDTESAKHLLRDVLDVYWTLAAERAKALAVEESIQNEMRSTTDRSLKRHLKKQLRQHRAANPCLKESEDTFFYRFKAFFGLGQ